MQMKKSAVKDSNNEHLPWTLLKYLLSSVEDGTVTSLRYLCTWRVHALWNK